MISGFNIMGAMGAAAQRGNTRRFSPISLVGKTELVIPNLGDYVELEVIIIGADLVTSIQVSSDNGATFETANYNSTHWNNDPEANNTSGTVLVQPAVLGNASSFTRILGFNDPDIRTQAAGYQYSPSNPPYNMGGASAGNVAHNAIKLLAGGGPWTSGMVQLTARKLNRISFHDFAANPLGPAYVGTINTMSVALLTTSHFDGATGDKSTYGRVSEDGSSFPSGSSDYTWGNYQSGYDTFGSDNDWGMWSRRDHYSQNDLYACNLNLPTTMQGRILGANPRSYIGRRIANVPTVKLELFRSGDITDRQVAAYAPIDPKDDWELLGQGFSTSSVELTDMGVYADILVIVDDRDTGTVVELSADNGATYNDLYDMQKVDSANNARTTGASAFPLASNNDKIIRVTAFNNAGIESMLTALVARTGNVHEYMGVTQAKKAYNAFRVTGMNNNSGIRIFGGK